MTFRIKKVHPDIIVPKRVEDSAGFDIYSPKDVTLEPFSVTKINLGFSAAFPIGYVGRLCDRSSMGKRGVHVFGGVIDFDYRGQWAVLLYNSKNETQEIIKGDRVAQLLFYPILSWLVEEVEELEGTKRGVGGFGSTGR